MLGPLLFIIYDDTKVGIQINNIADCEQLQLCIDNMLAWSGDWKMSFNIPKCKVLHTGLHNLRFKYKMNDQLLAKVDMEKDVGINITSTLKPSEHCKIASRTAMKVLFQLLRAFTYRDKKVFLKLYITYVRPHVEFAAPVWSPWLSKDVIALERVQEKFVKNVQGLHNHTYQEKLHELGILSLENRRKYLDIVECFKIIHCFTNVDRRLYFELVSDSNRRPTRATLCPVNIVVQRCNLEVRRNFFNI